jgi:hypothetical protein
MSSNRNSTLPSSSRHNRSRSRSRSNSPYFPKPKPKQYANQTNITALPHVRIGSGPLHFKGSKGAQLIKTPLATPTPNSTPLSMKFSNLSKGDKKNFENEYAAYEWEEMEKDMERTWYTLEEGGAIEDGAEFFIGDNEKYRYLSYLLIRIR